TATTTAEGESSGGGPPSSVHTVAPEPTISTAFWATSGQHLQDTTMLAKTNSSETGGPTTPAMADQGTEDPHPALIYGIPVVLVLILVILLAIFISRQCKQKDSKQDELGSENCKSPIFEEDTPSVMEIEMEELDKWMNSLKQNAECEYLPPVKEEKDYNTNP
ncbi:hypothetical protein EYD10_09598, partial [Varanus komodoensis]